MESEPVVITKAKDQCGYVLTVTRKSPKLFRFPFISPPRELCTDIPASPVRSL